MSALSTQIKELLLTKLSEGALGDGDRLDSAGAKLCKFDPNHEATHSKLVGHLLSKGHSFPIAKGAADNRISLRKILMSVSGPEADKSRSADWDSSDSKVQRSD